LPASVAFLIFIHSFIADTCKALLQMGLLGGATNRSAAEWCCF